MIAKKQAQYEDFHNKKLEFKLKLLAKEAVFNKGFVANVKYFGEQFSKAKGVTGKMKTVMDFMKTPGGFKTVAGAAGIGLLVAGFAKIGEGLKKLKEGLDGLIGINLSLNPIVAVFQILWKSITELWEYTDKRIMPLMAESNKLYGNMGNKLSGVRKQAEKTRNAICYDGLWV